MSYTIIILSCTNKCYNSFIVLESIRKMRQYIYKDVSDIEIEKPLKNWMAQSSARIKKTMEKSSISDKS